METPDFCCCPGCLHSLPPAVGATAGHLRKLATMGSLPDPAFQPYPHPADKKRLPTLLPAVALPPW